MSRAQTIAIPAIPAIPARSGVTKAPRETTLTELASALQAYLRSGTAHDPALAQAQAQALLGSIHASLVQGNSMAPPIRSGGSSR